MGTLLSVLEMVLPVAVMIAIGVFCNRRKVITPQGVLGIKTLVSNLMLPVVLFNALATARYSLGTVILFLVVVAVSGMGLALGYLTRRLMGGYGRFSPFLVTCSEVGMLGYALFALLVGSDKLYYLAALDLGNIAFGFTLYLALLLVAAGGEPTPRAMVGNMLKSPCFIGAALGALVGATGLGSLVLSSAVGGICTAVISLVTAPTSALILLAVGYEFAPSRRMLGPVLKVAALRLCIMGAMLAVSCGVIFALVPFEREQLLALILYFALPAPLFIPIYANSEEQGEFLSTSLSLYMVVTLAVYAVLATLVTV